MNRICRNRRIFSIPALLEEAFALGNSASGKNVSFKDVVSRKRNQGAGTFDVLMHFSAAAPHSN